MNTQIRSTDMALPPPSVTEDLMDRERTVGWITDRAFGFHGFANESEAAGAAWVAHRAVARALARRAGERQIPIDVEPLSLARFGDREVIVASNREVATLVRPGHQGRTGIDSFGFELELPAPVDELTIRSMAYVAYRSLRRSGVRWAMWMPERVRTRPAATVNVPTTRGAPSTAIFVGRFLLAGTGIAAAMALVASASRTVTLPLLFVFVGYAIGAYIASIALRHSRPSGSRRTLAMLRRGQSGTEPGPDQPKDPATRFATAWLVLAALSGTLLALGLIVSGALRSVLAAAGLAGLVIVRLVAIHGQWAPRGAAWATSNPRPAESRSRPGTFTASEPRTAPVQGRRSSQSPARRFNDELEAGTVRGRG